MKPYLELLSSIKENITFENIIIFLVFVLYGTAAIVHIIKNNYSWACVWGLYAASNIALLVAQSK